VPLDNASFDSALDEAEICGCNLARMRYDIVLAPGALEAMRKLLANVRSRVRDAMERHLRYEPARVSRSRIQRLKGLSQPQYRLRVDEVRVFYDVTQKAVEILAIVTKAEAQAWLRKKGKSQARGGAG
jgi:mRNA-degrading endonuclease RelE of RelBE toxin-antitoxin system